MKVSNNPKILVVGGAGFIGSCILRQLILKGYTNLVVFDNFSTGSRDSVPSECTVIEGDMRRIEDLCLLPEDIDYVFHIAAATSVEESFVKPGFYLENNVVGTINLLRWTSKTQVKKIIYSSSSAVYGDVDSSVVMKEDLAPAPINCYALTKLDGEYLLHMWQKNFGLDFAIVRYFNVFGDGQECTSAYASVIPKFIFAAMAGKDITIYGTGKQTRDFIHVEEAAEATITVMENAIGTYNVASAEQYDINTIATLILREITTSSEIVYLPPVPGDAMRDNGCNKKLTQLGWSRRHTFEYWLEKTIGWYQKSMESGKLKGSNV